jgi:hypothetical protein
MRFVFEFHGKDPTASGSGSHYSMGPITKPPVYHGFQANLVIVDCSQAVGVDPFVEGDALYLEGNGESIRKALTAALRILDGVEMFAVENAAREIARTRQCPACGCYVRVFEGKYDDHHPVTRKDHEPRCEASGTRA